MKKEPGKMYSVLVEDCEKHGPEISDVAVKDIDIGVDDHGNQHLFDKSGERIGYVASGSVGYTPRYAANWEATFGDRDIKPGNEIQPEDLN